MENSTNETETTTPAALMKTIQHLNVAAATAIMTAKLIMVFLILSSNAMVIFLYCRYKDIRKPAHNVFVMALAITDMCCGLLTVPAEVFKNVISNLYDPESVIPWYFKDKTICLTLLHVILQPLVWSVATLVAISTERLLAVLWPHSHKKFFTRSRAVMMVAGFWAAFSLPLFGCTLKAEFVTYNGKIRCTTGRQYDKGWETSLFWFMSLIPIAIAVLQYGAIFLKLRKQRLQVAPQNSVSQYKREYKITRGMALILFCFIICMLPFYMLDVLLDVTKYSDRVVRETLIALSLLLWYANSFINPILYAFVNESFKSNLRAMCALTFSRSTATREENA